VTNTVATQIPCLRAPVSRVLPPLSSDDEDRVETYANLLLLGWRKVYECIIQEGTVSTFCHSTQITEDFAPCSAFSISDLFALNALAGRRFDLTYPCGAKEEVGPLVGRPFY